jgi:transcriptional regulator with XRE-family HTH domain
LNNYLLTNMDTIDKINYYLTKNKRTGADLCEFLGVSSGVYSQWNTRRTKPRKSKLPAIAEYLGVSVADLLPDEDPSTGIKKDPIPKDEVVGSAKQKLLDALDGLSDSQIEKLIGIIEEAKKLL